MADEQFAQREASFNDNLGPTIGKFCVACVEADSQSKDAAAFRALKMLQTHPCLLYTSPSPRDS